MPRVVTVLALLAALSAVALVPVGCGDDSSQRDDFSSALGGEGEKDGETLGKYLQRVSQITVTDIAIVKAVNENDLETAQDKVDELDKMGTESLTIADDFEGAELRDLLTNYSKRISDVAGAYQDILDTPETASESKFQKLGEELGRQKGRLQVLDEKLQVAMKDVLPADDYKKIQDRMKKLQQQFDDAANGGG